MGTVQKPRGRGTPAIGSYYQRTAEDTADKRLIHPVVNFRVFKIATALKSIVVTSCKWSINQITNQNHVYSHSDM
jgi:hypothetical protein